MGYGRYQTWIFDCDGVLLDSNQIKTQAFATLAQPYGPAAVQDLVDYHQSNGGLSRFKKLEYFLRKYSQDSQHETLLRDNLDQFGALVHARLLDCPLNLGVLEFLEQIQDKTAFVVSGGMQDELREVFAARGLTRYFRAIYGSPDSKSEILHRIRAQGNLKLPAVFVGDSRLDYEVAAEYELDFIFMSRLSEFKGWETYFADKSIEVCHDFSNLSITPQA